MNSTLDSSTDIELSREAVNDIAYSIVFSIILLVVLAVISYISYKCNRSSASSTSAAAAAAAINQNTSGTRQTDEDLLFTIPQPGGLDETTLLNYPKLLYSQLKARKDQEFIASGCSICLADYKETDMIRLLPECGHIFHLQCIDPWLTLHPTCPICRTSPLPTPLELVVPLSTHQN